VRRIVILAVVAMLPAACKKKQADPSSAIQTAAVTRQDIVVDVEATGVVQPINAVQVRSKASGQIINMPVELGSRVKPGDLLVQVDPRQVRNLFNQAQASLAAAQANLAVTKTQLERAQALAQQGVITAPELESAQLNYANAQSQVASAHTSLDNAKIALEDATIRAPIAGVIIEKDVSLGQVISSATNTVGGGTLLLQMADLSQVMDSALVSESDIGNVKPGLTSTVKVDAYPNRVFHGTVEKIAPQATVQQSVTMFPVLIHLDNQDGALMPGMNSDVSVLVSDRPNAIAVPNDAIRQPRDAPAVAIALGLDPQRVQQEIDSEVGRRRPGGAGDTAAGAGMVASRGADGANGGAGRPRLNGQRGAGGFNGGRRPGGFGGGGRQFAMRFGGQQGGSPADRAHAGLVFVAQNGTFVPRIVALGAGNYDVTEVLSGLKEGDQVALVTTAMLMQARDQRLQRIRGFTSLPGMRQQPQRPAASARRPAAGGNR